jgi:hypothetical protein
MPHGGAAVAAITIVLLLMNLPPAIEWHERDRVGWSGWLTHVLRGVPVGVVAGVEAENAYLARVVPSYRAWRFIDTTLPSSSRILSFSGGDNLYSDRSRISSDAIIAHAAVWGTEAGNESAAARALNDLGVTHVLFDKRQFGKGLHGIAIGSAEMRRCCLLPIYEDDRFALYEVRTGRAQFYPGGFAPRTPRHASSLAATAARSGRVVARSRPLVSRPPDLRDSF